MKNLNERIVVDMLEKEKREETFAVEIEAEERIRFKKQRICHGGSCVWLFHE
jgi:hypothetical protein